MAARRIWVQGCDLRMREERNMAERDVGPGRGSQRRRHSDLLTTSSQNLVLGVQVWLEHDSDWIYADGPTGHLHDVYFNQ